MTPQSINWSLQLTIPIVWIELTPVIGYHVVAYLEAGDKFPTDDPLGMPLTHGGITERLDPMSTFKRYWNGPHAKRTPGVDHHLQADKPVKAIVRDAAGVIVTRNVEDFGIKYHVEQRSWLGQFKPAECRGIVDYLNHSAFVASYLPISELPFQRDERWELIEDIAKVAVNLRGTVVTTERIVLIDELTSAQLSVMYLGPNR